MSRSVILALVAVGLLSACAGKLGGPAPAAAIGSDYTNSIGFTGVGAERF